MNKPYKRVTPIGYNTGKIVIGGHYIPRPKAMTDNECLVQGLILGRRLPLEVRLRDAFLSVKSAAKLSLVKVQVTISNLIKELQK